MADNGDVICCILCIMLLVGGIMYAIGEDNEGFQLTGVVLMCVGGGALAVIIVCCCCFVLCWTVKISNSSDADDVLSLPQSPTKSVDPYSVDDF